jgi:hypothetical protein
MQKTQSLSLPVPNCLANFRRLFPRVRRGIPNLASERSVEQLHVTEASIAQTTVVFVRCKQRQAGTLGSAGLFGLGRVGTGHDRIRGIACEPTRVGRFVLRKIRMHHDQWRARLHAAVYLTQRAYAFVTIKEMRREAAASNGPAGAASM